NIEFEIEGLSKNSIVADQKYVMDEDGNKILKLVTKAAEKESGLKEQDIIMPYLKGMSIRSCIKVLSSLGVEYEINGTGKILTQNPQAGELINMNQPVLINCSSSN
ncbi:MAG TPA: PASTA domain-containing protein, partial [Ignavibacteria bacterium]